MVEVDFRPGRTRWTSITHFIGSVLSRIVRPGWAGVPSGLLIRLHYGINIRASYISNVFNWCLLRMSSPHYRNRFVFISCTQSDQRDLLLMMIACRRHRHCCVIDMKQAEQKSFLPVVCLCFGLIKFEFEERQTTQKNHLSTFAVSCSKTRKPSESRTNSLTLIFRTCFLLELLGEMERAPLNAEIGFQLNGMTERNLWTQMQRTEPKTRQIRSSPMTFVEKIFFESFILGTIITSTIFSFSSISWRRRRSIVFNTHLFLSFLFLTNRLFTFLPVRFDEWSISRPTVNSITQTIQSARRDFSSGSIGACDSPTEGCSSGNQSNIFRRTEKRANRFHVFLSISDCSSLVWSNCLESGKYVWKEEEPHLVSVVVCLLNV